MNSNLISEDLRDSPTVFNIIKYLIDNRETQYIPYRAYSKPFVYRIELQNGNRMDAPDILQKLRIFTLPGLIEQEFQWLYIGLWSRFIVHGDLTNNNIVYQDGILYFIDWELSNVVQGNMCGLWYVFADMIDYLNVFYQILPGMYQTRYKTSREEFETYYNIIKGQEEIMKYNENIDQCVQSFQKNIQILQGFSAFIKRVSGIDLTPMINNVIRQHIKGGKRRIKQKRTKRKTSRRGTKSKGRK